MHVHRRFINIVLVTIGQGYKGTVDCRLVTKHLTDKYERYNRYYIMCFESVY